MDTEKISNEARRIADEAAQLISDIEDAASTGEVDRPAPTAYSSSTESVEVDPHTGNIKVTTILYPGDTPIQPIPTQSTEQAAQDAVTVPPVAEGESPAGQVPAE